MELFTSVGDVIIFIAAIFGAIAGIWKFFSNLKKGVKGKVDEIKQHEQDEFNEKFDARVQEMVVPMLQQTARTLTGSFEGLLDKYLPERLVEHDLETRQKYLADRQRYLCEIKDEVVTVMKDRLEAVETQGDQMNVFTEVLKELLRERIMEIYRRNKKAGKLEEHERIELRQAYAAYKSINGNSYIDGYYNIMDKWETVPDEK